MADSAITNKLITHIHTVYIAYSLPWLPWTLLDLTALKFETEDHVGS